MPISRQITTGHVPIKVWTPSVEETALKQLQNIASLPIIHGHVAAMPDVHAGIGATVGSVIPTKAAIIPSAVGVDIGCFTGDTKVILADSRPYRLDELAKHKKPFHIHACDEAGIIRCAEATAAMTRRDASLVEVELDNGERIRCTPDHRFMLRDRSYAEARTLAAGSSLMPFDTRIDKDGYLRIRQPITGLNQRAHWIIARSRVAGSGQRGRRYLESCNKSEKGRAKSREMFANHKVLSVRALVEREDVYCLTVPEYHNFALAAGVFVHNCGMNAVQLSLAAKDLPESLAKIRRGIEHAVPVGFDMHSSSDIGDDERRRRARELQRGLARIVQKNGAIATMQKDFRETWLKQLGTLGGGNHFIEICLDESEHVWVMLHSGSRGIGNVIGRYFIERARREMEKLDVHLPDRDLGWLAEGTRPFDDYVEAVHWAQDYALENRREMMKAILEAMRSRLPPFRIVGEAISCHHNYVARERHFGAGRATSRGEAKRRFGTEDMKRQTEGIECRKDAGVLDEIPSAYKPIEEVMANQSDLVDIVHTLRQVVCVKG